MKTGHRLRRPPALQERQGKVRRPAGSTLRASGERRLGLSQGELWGTLLWLPVDTRPCPSSGTSKPSSQPRPHPPPQPNCGQPRPFPPRHHQGLMGHLGAAQPLPASAPLGLDRCKAFQKMQTPGQSRGRAGEGLGAQLQLHNGPGPYLPPPCCKDPPPFRLGNRARAEAVPPPHPRGSG